MAIVLFSSYRRLALFAALLAALFVAIPSARAQAPKADKNKAAKVKSGPTPECSLSKTNQKCVLIINRSNPVAPSAIQMYSGEYVTVVVKNPKSFERYFLDFQTGQATLSPDVASSVVQGLFPALAKLQISAHVAGAATLPHPCAVAEFSDPQWPKAKEVKASEKLFSACLDYLAHNAVGIYHELEPFVAPDSRTPGGITGATEIDDAHKAQIHSDIKTFLDAETAMSGKIASISGDTKYKIPEDAPAVAELVDIQKLIDAVAADLLGYDQRIKDIGNGYEVGWVECEKLIDVTTDEKQKKIMCVSIDSGTDDPKIYRNMVTRTITYSLNTLNLVSNSQETAPDPTKKKPLASVAINFADTRTDFHSAFRIEASAGVFFSGLPIRSFSASPVFTNGVITDKKIVDNVIHPTVVPFGAANYRLTNDLPWSRWKSNFYLTGAVGINPNTVSADFATGVTYAYRALMVSALCHFGHEVRLTQGLTVGESLGATFNGSIPTKTFWTESFAIGVSVRIPSLVGR